MTKREARDVLDRPREVAQSKNWLRHRLYNNLLKGDDQLVLGAIADLIRDHDLLEEILAEEAQG